MKHPGVSEKLKGRKRDKSISEKVANKLRGRKNPTAGAKISAKLKGKKHSIEQNIAQSKRQKGRIWTTNGIINRYVFPNDIPDGFFHGRIIKGKLKTFNT